MASRKDLEQAYANLSSKLVRSTGDIAARAFENLGSWRDEDVQRYLDTLAKVLPGVKKQAANLTLNFYKEIAKLEGEVFTTPAIKPSELTTEALRNGATFQEVYRRPFVDVYTELKKSNSLTQAVKLGSARARDLASTEITLARRGAGLFARNSNDGIVGYLRVLSGAENCGLCFVASTQRYNRGDLMPIHPGCDCGEQPIYGTSDPGQVINEMRLDAVHETIEQRFGAFDYGAREPDYRNVILVEEHGELGPVLTVKGQNFTGPEDL